MTKPADNEVEFTRMLIDVAVETAVKDFAHAVLHGDDEHRRWLIMAADQWVRDRTTPAPTGGNSKKEFDAGRVSAFREVCEFLNKEITDCFCREECGPCTGCMWMARIYGTFQNRAGAPGLKFDEDTDY